MTLEMPRLGAGSVRGEVAMLHSGTSIFLKIRRQLTGAFLWALFLSAGTNILMLTSPLYMMQIFDRVLTGRHEETLVMLSLIAFGAYATYGLLDWARNQLMARAGSWFENALSETVIRAGLQSTLAGRPVGGQAIRDLGQVRSVIAGRALLPFFDLPWAVGFLLLLFALDPLMGGYALLSAFVLAILAVLGEWSARSANKRFQQSKAQTEQWASQAIDQAEVVVALGMQDNLLSRYKDKAASSCRDHLSALLRSEGFGAMARSGRQMAQVGIMALAAWLMLQGELSPGLVIGGALLLARALAPIDGFIGSWQQLVQGRAALARLKAVLDGYNEAVLSEPPAPRAALVLNNLHKRAPGQASGFLLQGIGLQLDAGEALGVMGPSGAGKTTLCRLLAGVMIPEIGEVRLDGARLDQWPAGRLGPYIGYLPQEVGLPPATIAETISRLAPQPDLEAVYAAAKLADAHEMILGLPKGYDTPVGVGGVSLSGGQKQRVGLARALYGNPVLVVLDEPDAHLDTEGGRALFDAITHLKQRGVTVILTSHRPVVLKAVDKVMVMADGKVSRLGPRDEVLLELTGRGQQQRTIGLQKTGGQAQ